VIPGERGNSFSLRGLIYRKVASGEPADSSPMNWLVAWSFASLATNAAGALVWTAFVGWQRRHGNQIDWW